jgi:RNA polymerase sigma-70 factor (ECF subfamily)
MTGDLGIEQRKMAVCDGRSRDEREEALWLARARSGDEAAYRWLLNRYRVRVVRLAAHVLRRDGEAEDVAQEAFLRAFRRLPSFQGSGPFSSWLFQIVIHLCLDRRRAVRWGREVPAESAPALSSSPDPTDTRLLVEALLDHLSPPIRAALVLREMEGLEYDEIAQTLGIPVGTVRSRLNTARAQFRALWTAAQEDTPRG